MELPVELKTIRGAQQFHEWFGYWLSFHDAEVIALHLNRRALSSLILHTWETTKKLDAEGCFVMEKYVVVEFVLKEVSELNLRGFNHQNVPLGLAIEKVEAGFRLTLDDSYGLAGTIEARDISIRLTSGGPRDATL